MLPSDCQKFLKYLLGRTKNWWDDISDPTPKWFADHFLQCNICWAYYSKASETKGETMRSWPRGFRGRS